MTDEERDRIGFARSVNMAANKLDSVLQLLRALKTSRINRELYGVRELSMAITNIEQGCKDMNTAVWADKPYDPRCATKKFLEKQK